MFIIHVWTPWDTESCHKSQQPWFFHKMSQKFKLPQRASIQRFYCTLIYTLMYTLPSMHSAQWSTRNILEKKQAPPTNETPVHLHDECQLVRRKKKYQARLRLELFHAHQFHYSTDYNFSSLLFWFSLLISQNTLYNDCYWLYVNVMKLATVESATECNRYITPDGSGAVPP